MLIIVTQCVTNMSYYIFPSRNMASISEELPNSAHQAALLSAANNVRVFSGLIVIHAGSARHFSVDFVGSVTTLSGRDDKLAVGIARSAVVDLVAGIAVLVGAAVVFGLITDLARVGAKLRVLIFNAVELAAISRSCKDKAGNDKSSLHCCMN